MKECTNSGYIGPNVNAPIQDMEECSDKNFSMGWFRGGCPNKKCRPSVSNPITKIHHHDGVVLLCSLSSVSCSTIILELCETASVAK
jgi:hypothetical protein